MLTLPSPLHRCRETKSTCRCHTLISERPDLLAPWVFSPPPCLEELDFMRGSRSQGTRPFPSTELRAKVSVAQGWRQAGQRGTWDQSASPGVGRQIPQRSSPRPSPASWLKTQRSLPPSVKTTSDTLWTQYQRNWILIPPMPPAVSPTCNQRGYLFVSFFFLVSQRWYDPRRLRGSGSVWVMVFFLAPKSWA